MLKVISIFSKCSTLRFSTKAAEKSVANESFIINTDINGMTVVSIHPKVRGISKIAAVFNAGSRFEKYETRGMNHLLRRSVGLACNNLTAVSITRHMQQMGVNLRCFGTRETLSYVTDFSFDMLPTVGELLSDITTRQSFYNWELRDYAKPLMLTDIQYLNRRDFDTLCSELLHKAAFGDSLGNSLFADESHLGSWNLEQIENFLDHTFVPKKSMLVGVSVKHDHLLDLAEKFKIRPLKELASVSKFRGGEIRRELPLDYAKVALAWETPGFNGLNCALAASLLAYSVDNGVNNRIKWSSGGLGLLSKANVDASTCESCVANSINVSYSDKGMLGFTVTGAPDVMKEVVTSLYAYFISVGKSGVSQPDFDVAKTLLINDILMRCENGDGLLENVISQATSINGVVSHEQLIEKVKSLSLVDVNKMANNVLESNKRAMAAVGDLSRVPFLADLVTP